MRLVGVSADGSADLLRLMNGEYCWHQYDSEGNMSAGRFSINYKTEDEAREAWPEVKWE